MNERRLSPLILATILALGLLAFLVHAGSQVRAAPFVAQPLDDRLPAKVRDLHSNQYGLQFTLTTPDFTIENGGEIEVLGLDNRIQEPGAPSLPLFVTYIALPPGASIAVDIEELDVATRSVGRVVPVPRPAAYSVVAGVGEYSAIEGNGRDLRTNPPPLAYVADKDIYGTNKFYPGYSFNVSAPMYARDLRLVELRLYPLSYNALTAVLRQARKLRVSVRFEGTTATTLRPSNALADRESQGLNNLVLNMDQAEKWRGLPDELLAAGGTNLPLGRDLYKIELDHDGIYEISGAQLLAAGMPITNVNPVSIEMMYRGQPVAYEFIGDNDAVFEPGERVRFYGWAFDAPKVEEQFITNNVFWLWDGGSATRMVTVSNAAGMGYPVDTDFLTTVTREPENHYFATWTLWDGFPNEPDAWFWDYIKKAGTAPLTLTYPITLPFPVSDGSQAEYLVEMSSAREILPPSPPHLVRAYINSNPSFGKNSWYGYANVNVTNTIPISGLIHGQNLVTVVVATDYPFQERLYLNRISVKYTRQMIAEGDQLFFSDEVGGSREYHVGGFVSGDASDILALDISNPRLPTRITLDAADILTGGTSFTYTIGVSNSLPVAKYLVTTLANVLTETQINRYRPPSLDPVDGRAEWLAITHGDFVTPAQQLATHRASATFGNMNTYIVDIEDVINQYGYGLPLPKAINDYLAHALASWSTAPRYVVLFGDATHNPRQLDCQLRSQGGNCKWWDQNEPTFLITDLVFKDRFQGMIPTDHTFVMLSGNDLLPDMAIGRIPAQTITEAQAVVDKIIQFESNQQNPQDWQRNFLFVADNADEGGDFCAANQATGQYIPSVLDQFHLCLGIDGTTGSAIRALMDPYINSTGVSVLSYRGHGSLDLWANELILTSSDTNFWQNANKPVTIISADCLDGYFAWPGSAGLGETFFQLTDRGSVAHWSSSGLGYTGEHTVLHTGYLEGIFDLGLTAIGDAVNYAKMRYAAGGYDESEMYSFILLGDPAMQLMRPDISLEKTAPQPDAHPGETVDFTIVLSNTGIYPSLTRVGDTLPPGLSFQNAVASVPIGVNANGRDVSISLQSPLAWGASETITVTALVSPTFLGNAINMAAVTNADSNLSGSAPLSDTAAITVTDAIISGLIALNNSPTALGSLTTVSATQATGSNVSYLWYLGDGQLGSGRVTGHVYPETGIYTATVIASNTVSIMTATTRIIIGLPYVTYLPITAQP